MKILIAEDDLVSSRILATTLTKWGHEVVITDNGFDALAELQKDDAPRLAILDWMMPGIEGPEVCRRIRQQNKTTPTYMILLTALAEKAQMVAGLEAGADDYLTKPFDRHELRVRVQAGERIVELQSSLVQRVKELEVAIGEREEAEKALLNLSLTDDLTGLYNRRGFFTLTEHRLAAARRAGQSSLLFYADLDGLKLINDTYGHSEGSVAITITAEILGRTFRNSDVVARTGGDEFAILAQNASDNETSIIVDRLEENFRAFNAQSSRPYQLSLSMGAVLVDLNNDQSVDDLICKADEAMYAHKRSKESWAGALVEGRPLPGRITRYPLGNKTL
ncbi:MAG TPA: diguanylate cyclase [Pyrinomonadaceae bacterium]|nr:diguanylate cyclase [Pyrinomonadaceae bacterium]